MATYKSDIVSARDSGDQMASQGLAANDKRLTAILELSGAITTSDVAAICRLPIDARIRSLILRSDDLGTTGDFNIGFHQIGAENTVGDAIDADAMGTAVDVNAAALAGSELRYETKDIDTANDKVWELGGLSSRPSYGECFLTITPSEDTTAAGTVVVEVLINI